MAKNRVIGKNNGLPWHFSSDLKHFKQLTTGNTVLMGRKTFESIGKPLPNRESFVLSKSKHQDKEHLKFFDSITSAIQQIPTQQGYIIGGETLYQQTLDGVDGIYLTLIDAEYEGDAYYPEIPPYFKEKSRKKLQDNPKIEVIFYERIKGSKS